jgi:hypothetical protein
MALKLKAGASEERYQEPYVTHSGGVPALEVHAVKESWIFPYAHFIHARLNPSHDLVILFVTHQVIVSGRNLKPLYEALSLLSLQGIKLTEKFGVQSQDNDTVIDSIEVIPSQGNED